MKSKDEVLYFFKAYYNMIETKFDMKTKALQFDNGKEYYVKESQSYLSDDGIESRTLCVYTRAEWNCYTKRKHLVEVMKALLNEMNVSKSFWSDTQMEY